MSKGFPTLGLLARPQLQQSPHWSRAGPHNSDGCSWHQDRAAARYWICLFLCFVWNNSIRIKYWIILLLIFPPSHRSPDIPELSHSTSCAACNSCFCIENTDYIAFLPKTSHFLVNMGPMSLIIRVYCLSLQVLWIFWSWNILVNIWIFYRTRVRSLATLVSNSLTDSLTNCCLV